MVIALALSFALSAAPPSDPVVVALEKDGVKGLRATFDVDVPAPIVLDVLWDVRRFQSIFPDIKQLEVLQSGADGADSGWVDARFFVDAVFKDVSYTLRRRLDREKRVISWRNIGGDLQFVDGSWTVSETGDAGVARVVYTSFVDVGYVVPTGLVRDVAIGKVNEMAKRVRRACADAVAPPIGKAP